PHRVGRAVDQGRTDRLVRVLGRLAALELARGLGDVRVAERALDPLAHLPDRLAGEARRIRAHVGDEADAALAPEIDAHVELLRDPHGALGGEAAAVSWSTSRVQYSSGTNALIASSRSQMSRSATLWTRPAESP